MKSETSEEIRNDVFSEIQIILVIFYALKVKKLSSQNYFDRKI